MLDKVGSWDINRDYIRQGSVTRGYIFCALGAPRALIKTLDGDHTNAKEGQMMEYIGREIIDG